MTPSASGLAALKTERLERLKQRAQAVLGQYKGQVGLTDNTLDQARLLEDLRIYQVELELQNDELRAAQQDADLLRRRYQSLFEHMPLSALVVDGQGSIDDCNERAVALLGGTRPQTSPDNRFWKAVHQNDRSRVYAALREVRSGETQVLPQVQMTHSDARTLVFDVHLIGLSMDYKLDRRLLLLLVDRTVEMARAADQRFFSELLDASHSLIYAVDRQGKVLLANQTMLQFLGLERARVQGHSREDFLTLRDAITLADTDSQVLQTGVATTLEEKIHGAAGGAVDFLSRKFPLRDLQGNIYALGAISTDITSLKQQQREQLLSETVFMASQEAIIITDATGAIVRINPAFTRLSGFSADAVMGRNPRLLKSGRHGPDFYESLWAALTSSGCWSGEICNRRSDGREYNVLCSINAVRDEDGSVLYYFATQTDVTLLHQTQLRLLRQATHDELTDLPNRALFNDRASQLLASAKRHNQPFTLLFIDLDRFKEVNDTLGHPVGDVLLQEVARRLQESLRQEDTVARVGGDEFAVLLPATETRRAQAVAGNLLARLREPLALVTQAHYRPMASVGLASFPQDGDTPDLLLRNADMAMYSAKVSGRNRIAVYSPQMSHNSNREFALQADLSEAVDKGQLRVYFQPKCQLGSGALAGAEALVRWERPGHGLQLPGEFIRLAEKTGLLGPIDQWVLGEVVRQLGCWRRAGVWRDGWIMTVNQNVADQQGSELVDRVKQLLEQHAVSAGDLELEITEDALLHQTPTQLRSLCALRDLGVTLAIDDFGTGYSSLAYLRELPISVIKIDRSFVGNMLLNCNDAVLVRTIIDLGHNLGHTLLAEGIELPEQAQRLASLGCECGQGYLLGKPTDAHTFGQRWLGLPQDSANG